MTLFSDSKMQLSDLARCISEILSHVFLFSEPVSCSEVGGWGWLQCQQNWRSWTHSFYFLFALLFVFYVLAFFFDNSLFWLWHFMGTLGQFWAETESCIHSKCLLHCPLALALIFAWGGFTYHYTAIHGRAVVTEADNEMSERDDRLLTAVRLFSHRSSHYVTLHEMTSHYMISLYPFLSVLAFHLIFFRHLP